MDNLQNLLSQVAIIKQKNDELIAATGGNFNMFRVCGVNYYENTHSAILAEFLRPDGTHGFKEKFLQCFVDMFCGETLKQNFMCDKAKVHTEHTTDEGRIDILIEDGKRAIIIENKIYAGDQWEQLKRYNKYAENKFGTGNYQIFYLNLWGHEASEQSGEGVSYIPLSYEKNVIAWLEECCRMAALLPTVLVRDTIIQYINHLKSLTNQGMATQSREEITQLLCRDENIKPAFIIGDNLTNLKNYLINEKFLPQIAFICEELKLDNKSQKQDWVNGSYTGFVIHNPKWKFFNIKFSFFCKIGLENFFFGISHIDKNDKNPIKNDTLSVVIKRLSQENYQHTDQWAAWKWFIHPYKNWGLEAMMAIHDGSLKDKFKHELEKLLELTKGIENM